MAASTTSWRVVLPGVALTLALALAARFGSSEPMSVRQRMRSASNEPS